MSRPQSESPALSLSISPAEYEFFAEEEVVTITTNIDLGRLQFISGTFGPVYAGEPIEVPLWLAIALRRKGKCSIAIPEWLTVEKLEMVLREETDNHSFQDLPFHFVEIAKLLLSNAKEDIDSPDRVGVLVKDIENIRMAKMRVGCRSVDSKEISFINITGIAAIEVAASKGFLLSALYARQKLVAEARDNNSASAGAGLGFNAGGGRLGEINESLINNNNNSNNNNGGGGLTRRFRDG